MSDKIHKFYGLENIAGSTYGVTPNVTPPKAGSTDFITEEDYREMLLKGYAGKGSGKRYYSSGMNALIKKEKTPEEKREEARREAVEESIKRGYELKKKAFDTYNDLFSKPTPTPSGSFRERLDREIEAWCGGILTQ